MIGEFPYRDCELVAVARLVAARIADRAFNLSKLCEGPT